MFDGISLLKHKSSDTDDNRWISLYQAFLKFCFANLFQEVQAADNTSGNNGEQ